MLDLAVPWLVIVFLVGAAATWVAGIRLGDNALAIAVFAVGIVGLARLPK